MVQRGRTGVSGMHSPSGLSQWQGQPARRVRGRRGRRPSAPGIHCRPPRDRAESPGAIGPGPSPRDRRRAGPSSAATLREPRARSYSSPRGRIQIHAVVPERARSYLKASPRYDPAQEGTTARAHVRPRELRMTASPTPTRNQENARRTTEPRPGAPGQASAMHHLAFQDRAAPGSTGPPPADAPPASPGSAESRHLSLTSPSAGRPRSRPGAAGPRR